jgi:hypothetical protein
MIESMEVYFFLCDKALPAALFEALVVRPSRKTWEAAFATGADVRSLGALLCVNALAAAFLEFLPDDGLSKTIAAVFATFGLVPFFISPSI